MTKKLRKTEDRRVALGKAPTPEPPKPCTCHHQSEVDEIKELQRVRLFTDHGSISLELTDAGTWYIRKSWPVEDGGPHPMVVVGRHWVTLRTDHATVLDRKRKPQPVLQDQTQ